MLVPDTNTRAQCTGDDESAPKTRDSTRRRCITYLPRLFTYLLTYLCAFPPSRASLAERGGASCERGGAPWMLVPHLSLARTLPLLCSLAQPRATSPRADDPSSRARNIKTMLRSAQGVLWDVDGTLVESTDLAFVATNEVLEANGRPQITVEQYKVGCKFTTPERCAPSPSGA